MAGNPRGKKIMKLPIKVAILAGLFWSLVFTLLAHASVDTTKAVIHHTASHDVSAKTIDQWHKERGWDGIGYHFVIRQNGDIETGRNINKKGAHSGDYRNWWIGITLTGYDEFSVLQIKALKKLLKKRRIKHIERHHSNCPGKGLSLKGLLK